MRCSCHRQTGMNDAACHAIADGGKHHSLQHPITLLLENGCDIRYVQDMLGHANLETTEIYTHVSMRKLKLVHQKYHPAKLPAQT